MNIESMKLKDIRFALDGVEMFEPVNFDFPPGEVVVLSGKGGSGKSSLLKIMAGLLMPTSGSLYVNDQPVSEMSFEEFSPYRLNIGFGFEMGGLLNNKTIRQNLMLPLEYHAQESKEKNESVVKMMLDAFQLEGAADLLPARVSGSQRKAACVARAFIMNPQVLILDEPLTGLTNQGALSVETLISTAMTRRDLRYVVVSTSDEDFLSYLPRRRLTIENQRLVEAA